MSYCPCTVCIAIYWSDCYYSYYTSPSPPNDIYFHNNNNNNNNAASSILYLTCIALCMYVLFIIQYSVPAFTVRVLSFLWIAWVHWTVLWLLMIKAKEMLLVACIPSSSATIGAFCSCTFCFTSFTWSLAFFGIKWACFSFLVIAAQCVLLETLVPNITLDICFAASRHITINLIKSLLLLLLLLFIIIGLAYRWFGLTHFSNYTCYFLVLLYFYKTLFLYLGGAHDYASVVRWSWMIASVELSDVKEQTWGIPSSYLSHTINRWAAVCVCSSVC